MGTVSPSVESRAGRLGPGVLRQVSEVLSCLDETLPAAVLLRLCAAFWEADLSEVERLTAALTECRAALYGVREIVGNIGNIGHAIELADAALRGQPAPAKGRE